MGKGWPPPRGGAPTLPVIADADMQLKPDWRHPISILSNHHYLTERLRAEARSISVRITNALSNARHSLIQNSDQVSDGRRGDVVGHVAPDQVQNRLVTDTP